MDISFTGKLLKMDKQARKFAGFTMIEVIITLVIAAILLSLAAPSFVNIIKNNRLATEYNTLLSQINITKSEAVKRGTDVKILSNNGNSWEGGWTVFVDTDDDGIVDNGEEIIRIGNQAAQQVTITSSFSSLEYHGSGLGGPTGRLTFCDDRANSASFAKAIIINNTGRARAATSSDNVTCP